jgi:hypothetical protein
LNKNDIAGACIAHVSCEPIFNNNFGDNPHWIDPVTTLCIVTKNFQVIKPIANNDKLQSGLSNMMSLQAGITCLTEKNFEWCKYYFLQDFKDGVDKLFDESRHIFSSSSEIASESYHKRGGSLISATDI